MDSAAEELCPVVEVATSTLVKIQFHQKSKFKIRFHLNIEGFCKEARHLAHLILELGLSATTLEYETGDDTMIFS